MSARPFRFEPLLNFAERQEEQQMLVLANALHEEQAATAALAALVEQRETEFSRQSVDRLVDPDERQAVEAYLDRLGAQIDAQRGVLAEARDRVSRARDGLIELEREKQSLERLREQDEAQALDEANRREASIVDDLNMTRHVRHAQHGAASERVE